MRLALMIGHTPTAGSKGPVVYLGPGVWEIIDEMVGDTDYIVLTDRNIRPPTKNGDIHGPCNVQVQVTKSGGEPYINVYAEKQNVN